MRLLVKSDNGISEYLVRKMTRTTSEITNVCSLHRSLTTNYTMKFQHKAFRQSKLVTHRFVMRRFTLISEFIGPIFK